MAAPHTGRRDPLCAITQHQCRLSPTRRATRPARKSSVGPSDLHVMSEVPTYTTLAPVYGEGGVFPHPALPRCHSDTPVLAFIQNCTGVLLIRAWASADAPKERFKVIEEAFKKQFGTAPDHFVRSPGAKMSNPARDLLPSRVWLRCHLADIA